MEASAGQPPTADQTLGADLASRLQSRLASTQELLDAYESAKQLIARASRADLLGLLRGKDRNALGPSLRAFKRRGDLPEWVEADVTNLIEATVALARSHPRSLAPTQRPREANRKQRVDDVELEQPAPVSDVELEHPPEDEECKFELPSECVCVCVRACVWGVCACMCVCV